MINLKIYLISELLHKVGVGTEEEMENVMHKLAGWKLDCKQKTCSKGNINRRQNHVSAHLSPSGRLHTLFLATIFTLC